MKAMVIKMENRRKKSTRVGFVSLGCPKNQVDTEIMLAELSAAGYEITPEETEADIVVINTCAFIQSAKEEAIDNILDIAWLKKHAQLRGIVVTGCLAQRYQEEIFREMPEVDALLGVGSLHDIVDAVRQIDVKQAGKEVCRYSSFRRIEDMKQGGDRILTTPSYLAYMKISEGCDNRCTYCAIPLIRGGMRSRPIEALCAEAKELEGLGVRELVLVAQDTTAYGTDLYGEPQLARLIRALCDETSIPWIRVLYCYPEKITEELAKEWENNPRLLRYVDLPVQHLSDRVLRRMNRRGGAEAVERAVRRLRQIPGMVIRTTFLTGFPGESEEDFLELCEGAKRLKFDRVGVFPYSREEGTPAYDFEEQIEEQIKQNRCDILMREQELRSEKAARKKIGEVVTVLCEGYDSAAETYYGRTYADAYEIDGKVYFTNRLGNKRLQPGSFVKVKILENMAYDLVGELVSAEEKNND